MGVERLGGGSMVSSHEAGAFRGTQTRVTVPETRGWSRVHMGLTRSLTTIESHGIVQGVSCIMVH